VANTGDNTITTYTINGTTGALSGGANTVTTGTGIFTLVVDPTSTYLYVLDTTDGSSPGAILGFTLGADGSVGAAIPGTPIATDVNPFDIVIDPTGTLLAVTGNTGDTLTPFAVDPTTGTPTAGTPVTVGTSPLYVTFSVAP
jgi:6-phosphogluconolactonase (cycloisomerase 2 family)